MVKLTIADDLPREFFGTGNITHKAAQEVGPVILRLMKENGGQLTALDLLKTARDHGSPVRRHLTMDDTHAANLWRLDECQSLINGTHFRIRDAVGEVAYEGPIVLCVRESSPAPVTFQGNEYRRSPYVDTFIIKESREASDRVMEDAIMQVVAFRNRFTQLQATLGAKLPSTKRVRAALDKFAAEAETLQAKAAPQKKAA